jgi:hypothetical protein
VSFEQNCRQRRAQRQRIKGGNDGGKGDGQRKLPVELTGQTADEGDGNEDRTEHERDGDDGTGHFAHRLDRGVVRGQTFLDISFHVFHHDDGVIDHDADGQHQSKERKRVDRKSKDMHDGERAHDGDWHGEQWDDRGPPGLEKNDDDKNHHAERFEQGVDDRIDRSPHENGGVVDNRVVDAFREVLFEFRHLGPDLVGDIDCIRAGRLENRDRHREFIIEQRAKPILRGVDIDMGDILQPGDHPVRAAFDDDLFKLFRGLQTTLRVNRQLEFHAVAIGRATDLPGRHLDILPANRTDDFIRSQPALGHLLGIEPDAHRVIARSEKPDVAHAIDLCQLVLHVQHGVVPEIKHVVAIIGRGQVDDHGQIGRTLDRGDADLARHVGQARLGLVHPVLHELLSEIRIGPKFESDRQREDAVAGGLGKHVEHVLRPVDLFLQRRRHRFRDDLGICAGKLRRDDHRRRHDLGIF